MKFVVDESKWLRGNKRPNGLAVQPKLCNKQGEMCCLGFASIQLGVAKNAIIDVLDPHLIKGQEEKSKVEGILARKNNAGEWVNTKFTTAAENVNDDTLINDATRKRKLRQLAKTHGHQFIFRKSVEAAK